MRPLYKVSDLEGSYLCDFQRLAPFLKLNIPPFPDPLGSFCDLRWIFFFIVEEPVSMHVGWTNIYTLLVEGMKPAICPVWSAIT